MKLINRFIRKFLCLILLCSLRAFDLVICFGNDESERFGLHLGSFNTYSHQVSGDVYAVDQYTLLIKGFQYDGLGKDTFFWAGSTVRPSNVGFIVPDEEGRTNKLQRYTGKDITLRLPDNKKLTSIKWFCIWDFREYNNYGDIYISEGFEPPSPQQLPELSKLAKGVKSKPLIILDSKTLLIPELFFDGNIDDTFFWAGAGSSPDSNGNKVPDERGYLNSLSHYEGQDIIIELPGKMTFFDINWFSIYNIREDKNYGSILIPGGLNIPPALVSIIDHDDSLPNCEQLHKNLQLSWEVFGPQITFILSGLIDEEDYMSFGTSGSPNSTQMIGGDAVVAYMVGHSGFVVDYNITAKYPCSNVAGPYKGVCPDPKLGGVENYQFQTAHRNDGVTSVTFRRQQDNAGDHGDKVFDKEATTFLIWAMGKYNLQKEPGFHYAYPKGDTKVVFGRKPAKKNCYPFTKRNNKPKIEPWKHFELRDPAVKTFLFHLGPSGLTRGYSGTTGTPSPGYVWYVNGALAPNIYLKRGVKYLFRVEAGNNGFNAGSYNPLYITDDSHGGYSKMTEEERSKSTIYAGIRFDSKGRPQPTAAGRLCIWEHVNKTDRRRDDEYISFPKYRNSLKMQCEKGEPALMEWTPDEATPDLLYYQSYTQRNMGWKIFIVDELQSNAESLNVHLIMVLCSIVFLILF